MKKIATHAFHIIAGGSEQPGYVKTLYCSPSHKGCLSYAEDANGYQSYGFFQGEYTDSVPQYVLASKFIFSPEAKVSIALKSNNEAQWNVYMEASEEPLCVKMF
jgi:hypothetical protein